MPAWISLRSLAVALAAFVGLGLGCQSLTPSTPSTPSQILTVSSISPAAGLPAVATQITVYGRGFMPGAKVTIGGIAADVVIVSSLSLLTTAPPRALGAVDVVVSNPDGATATLRGGYTYANPPPPAITFITPTRVSVGGGATFAIVGSGFQVGAVVTFDGLSIEGFVSSSQINILHLPPHAVGPVDVVVTNPGGGTARLVGGLIYAPVDSFNFNAVWDGYRAESETPAFSFTVVNNALTSVTCRTALPIVLSPEVPVVNGTFSFSGADGTSMSGSIVADGQSTGTINLPVCGAMEWFGFRR